MTRRRIFQIGSDHTLINTKVGVGKVRGRGRYHTTLTKESPANHGSPIGIPLGAALNVGNNLYTTPENRQKAMLLPSLIRRLPVDFQWTSRELPEDFQWTIPEICTPDFQSDLAPPG